MYILAKVKIEGTYMYNLICPSANKCGSWTNDSSQLVQSYIDNQYLATHMRNNELVQEYLDIEGTLKPDYEDVTLFPVKGTRTLYKEYPELLL